MTQIVNFYNNHYVGFLKHLDHRGNTERMRLGSEGMGWKVAKVALTVFTLFLGPLLFFALVKGGALLREKLCPSKSDEPFQEDQMLHSKSSQVGPRQEVDEQLLNDATPLVSVSDRIDKILQEVQTLHSKSSQVGPAQEIDKRTSEELLTDARLMQNAVGLLLEQVAAPTLDNAYQAAIIAHRAKGTDAAEETCDIAQRLLNIAKFLKENG